MPVVPSVSEFISAARTICGAEHVAMDEKSETHCTSGVQRHVVATIFPRNAEEISALLSSAREHHVPVSPVSTGRNWGYGGDAPVTENAVILNLSRLNRISDYDPLLGVVTVEPGVTQGQLSEFLKKNGNKFACFVTGSSPECSLVGNALERGYGANPPTDHYAAVMSLSAIMPDGSVYQPLMSELGAGQADRLYRWGIGPYLDGLFSQSGLGVVVGMTLMLVPQPEETAMVFFDPAPEVSLADLVDMIRDIRMSSSDCLISMKILNQLYLTALAGLHLDEGQEKSAENFAALGRKNHMPAYKVVGMLSGTPRQIKATLKDMRRVTRRYKGRFLSLTQKQTGLLQTLIGLPLVSSVVPKGLQEQLRILERSYDLIRGIPSEKMLELAYWKRGHREGERGLHPARDGCGLLWMPFIVPNKGEVTETLHHEIAAQIWAAGLEPLMGLTHLNQASSVMLYGLIYEPENYEERIKPLHEKITACVRRSGLMAYRLHVDEIAALPKNNTAQRITRAVKTEFDPENIVGRGRFN